MARAAAHDGGSACQAAAGGAQARPPLPAPRQRQPAARAACSAALTDGHGRLWPHGHLELGHGVAKGLQGGGGMQGSLAAARAARRELQLLPPAGRRPAPLAPPRARPLIRHAAVLVVHSERGPQQLAVGQALQELGRLLHSGAAVCGRGGGSLRARCGGRRRWTSGMARLASPCDCRSSDAARGFRTCSAARKSSRSAAGFMAPGAPCAGALEAGKWRGVTQTTPEGAKWVPAYREH